MRSRVLIVKDPASIDLSTHMKPFTLDQAKLERELERLANPYVRWKKGVKVSEGDMVVCRLVSDCPRFNKDKVKFVAGSGMFHKELEALAIGMTVGETREADLTEGNVALPLAEVTNKIIPPVCDDMVEKLGLDGVCTLADYTAYLTRQQQEQALEEILFEPMNHLIHEMIDQSEFVLCREDWQHAVNLHLERNRVLFRREGLVMEELTAEQFEGRIPVKSCHELVALEALTLTVGAFASPVPDSFVAENLNGQRRVTKTYVLPPDTDPELLKEPPFDYGGFTYTWAYTTKEEHTFRDSKTVTQTVTVETAKKDLAAVLEQLAPTMPYDDGEYAGELALTRLPRPS